MLKFFHSKLLEKIQLIFIQNDIRLITKALLNKTTLFQNVDFLIN